MSYGETPTHSTSGHHVDRRVDFWSVLQRSAEIHSGRPAVLRPSDGEVILTYREMWTRVRAIAMRLRSLGAGCGARVVLLDDNSLEAFLAHLAAAAAHSVLIPVNPRLTPREIGSILADGSPAWVVSAPLFCRSLRLALASSPVNPRILWTTLPFRGTEVEETPCWVGECPLEGPVEGSHNCTCEDHDSMPMQVYYTSGTTGNGPRGAVFTSRAVMVNALSISKALNLGVEDVWGHFAPLYHVADACAVFPLTLSGCAHVFLPRFQPDVVADVINTCKVTVTFLVPTMVSLLLDVIPSGSERGYFPSMRRMMWGSAPCPLQLSRRAVEVVGNAFQCNYGLTETGGPIALGCVIQSARLAGLSLDDQAALAVRAGYPLSHVAVRVVDDAGSLVPLDGVSRGELQVSGEGIMHGYLCESPQPSHGEGRWIATGDLAVVESDGCLRIVGRKKDVIIVGGQNVMPTEVEAALSEHPGVSEAAVCGVPCDLNGEVVAAVFVARDGEDPSTTELRRHCAGLLAPFKTPRRLLSVPAIPRTAFGKVRVSVVRSILQGSMEALRFGSTSSRHYDTR